MKKQTWIGIFIAMLAVACMPLVSRAGDEAVAPFINAKTDAVVHVDMSRIDMDALNAWFQKYVDSADIPADKKAMIKNDTDKSMGDSKDWVAKFTKAGGKDLYVIVQISGLFMGEPPAVIVPLGAGADADALGKLFNPGGTPPGADAAAPATAVIGKNLVFASGTMLAALKTATGEARPDLVEALAVGGDSPVHLALASNGLKTGAPMIMGMGGAQSPGAKIVSDPAFTSIAWGGIALALPPKGNAKATLQCKDADSAAMLVTAINASLDKMKTDAKAKEALGENLDKFVGALKPTTDGTKVSITVDQPTVDLVMPSLVKNAANPPAPAPSPDWTPAPAPNGM